MVASKPLLQRAPNKQTDQTNQASTAATVSNPARSGRRPYPDKLPSRQRLDRPLAADRGPFGVFAHRLDAELAVDGAHQRRNLAVDAFGQELISVRAPLAYAVVLPRRHVEGEPWRIFGQRRRRFGRWNRLPPPRQICLFHATE